MLDEELRLRKPARRLGDAEIKRRIVAARVRDALRRANSPVGDALLGMYILEGAATRPVDKHDPRLNKQWESPRRQVAESFMGETRLSTCFLPIDHSFGNREPRLFETMVFGAGGAKLFDGMQWRYGTWEEARVAHSEIHAVMRSGSFRFMNKVLRRSGRFGAAARSFFEFYLARCFKRVGVPGW